MSESDEIDEIRERKRKELEERLEGGETTGAVDGADDAGGESTPTEPVHVHGVDELDDVVSKYDAVLVDFYADWCGPCKMLEPTVAELARETSAVVAKVDVDANQPLAAQYGVRGVPTLVFFADGEAVRQLVGVQDKSTLADLLAQHGAA
ncbi:MAG: thioredoxin [Salinigranum sp.]